MKNMQQIDIKQFSPSVDFFKAELYPIKRENQSEGQSLSLQNKQLSVDQNNSLALMVRNSMEIGMPIPRVMLSHDGPYRFEEDNEPEQSDQSSEEYQRQHIKEEVSEEAKEWFVQSLGLNDLLHARKYPTNTKNVLRNFGNAQNQYALYHTKAKTIVQELIASPEKFYQWVRKLKLEKFQDFKEVWIDEPNKAFRRVYKLICTQFYSHTAIPYVLSSRMKNVETKFSHLRYVYRFLEGLVEPEDFTYFKKVQK